MSAAGQPEFTLAELMQQLDEETQQFQEKRASLQGEIPDPTLSEFEEFAEAADRRASRARDLAKRLEEDRDRLQREKDQLEGEIREATGERDKLDRQIADLRVKAAASDHEMREKFAIGMVVLFVLSTAAVIGLVWLLATKDQETVKLLVESRPDGTTPDPALAKEMLAVVRIITPEAIIALIAATATQLAAAIWLIARSLFRPMSDTAGNPTGRGPAHDGDADS